MRDGIAAPWRFRHHIHMRLYLATGNPHKVDELSRVIISAGLDIEVFPGNKIGILPPSEETGDTFQANAFIKARALWQLVPPEDWVLADDSGLEVDALNGMPGVRSARYAGPNATDADNKRKLLEELEGVPDAERTACFICSLALIGPGEDEQIFQGICKGVIVTEPRGSQGFGYDPLFQPEGYDKTFAELGPSVKDTISHRARALTGLVDWLKLRG